MDLVTCNVGGTYYENGTLGLLFGNGDGTFQAPVNSSFYAPLSVAMGDLNGDGSLDLAVTIKVFTGIEPTFKVRQYDYYVAVLMNNLDTVNHFANLNWTAAYYLYSGGSHYPDSIKIANINGFPSVAFTNYESNSISVMPGNGTGSLGPRVNFTVGGSPHRLAVGDINGDGLADLVTANSSTNDVSVLLANSIGIPMFRPVASYPAGSSPTSVALADLNADGVSDVVVTNASTNSVNVLMNNTNGTFQSPLSYPAGASPSAVVVGNFNGDHSPSGKPYNDLAVVNASSSNAVSALLSAANWSTPSTIAGTGHEGRYIFYNNSKFDGSSGANNVSDNSAIPSNKSVYLPGDGQMVLANITNFTKGINGIMVDLTAGSADHTTINASDFVFKVGENNSPNTWTTLTATPTISVRTGGGISGSDRVDITWADNAIQDQYLEVQVLATAHTGLNATFGTISGNAVGDIFFFGNLRGETASTTPASFARIFATDGAAIQANGTSLNVGINSFLDVDRSNAVISAGDRSALIPLGTKVLTRISIGTAGPFAPEGGGAAPATAGGDAGISSGLAAAVVEATARLSGVGFIQATNYRADAPRERAPVVASPLDTADEARQEGPR